MSFFKSKPRTAQQKASWAKTRLGLRGAVLVYLIWFVIIPMIDPDPEEIAGMHPIVRYAILAFFIIACGSLAVLTILEYMRGKKDGRYTADYYEDDEGVESFPAVEEPTGDEEDSDDDDDDDDYEDDDEDDDDDYDDDDDDYDDDEDEDYEDDDD